MRFSIVTPSFNQADWLRLCLASVADQAAGGKEQGAWEKSTAPSSALQAPRFTVEHLVIDGGSTDETLSLLEAWGRERGAGNSPTDSREPRANSYSFSYLSEPDAGMYDALNKGFALATGDILAWLNCDEQYLPGTLALVADYFTRHPDTDVLLGDALLLNAELKPVSYRRIMVPSLWHTRLDHLHSLSCAMFFRKEAPPRPPLEKKWKIISDAVLMEHFLDKGLCIQACGIPLSAYVVTGQNLSWTGACKQEMRRWHGETGWPPALCRHPVVAWHRLRRWWHGGYAQRTVRAGLYTPDRPDERRFFETQIGGLWPSLHT